MLFSKSCIFGSVAAQERLLGAALGCALAGFVVFNERRDVYRSVSEVGVPSRVSSHKVIGFCLWCDLCVFFFLCFLFIRMVFFLNQLIVLD